MAKLLIFISSVVHLIYKKLFPTFFYFAVSHCRLKIHYFSILNLLSLPWDKSMRKGIRQAYSFSLFSLPGAYKWCLELWQPHLIMRRMWEEPRYTSSATAPTFFSRALTLAPIKITWRVFKKTQIAGPPSQNLWFSWSEVGC